jgi:spore coat protein U-like protein
MKLTKLFLVLASATSFVVGAGAPAFAVSPATNNLTVSANVANQCVVAAASLDFGDYKFDANTDGSATLTLTCTPDTTTTVKLGLGGNASGSQRNMLKGTDLLSYGLYTDAGRGTAWPVAGVAGPVGSGTVTVYGRIPSGQNKPTGIYQDTVVVSVDF